VYVGEQIPPPPPPQLYALKGGELNPKRLKDKKISVAKRKAIAGLEKKLIEELETMLARGVEKGCVTNRDSIMILESIAQMHNELYEKYE